MDINQREIALGKIFPAGQVLDRRHADHPTARGHKASGRSSLLLRLAHGI